MSTHVTGGIERNELARIYDRLRKRSLRSRHQKNPRAKYWAQQEYWDNFDHAAYVSGVKDALVAVEIADLDRLINKLSARR